MQVLKKLSAVFLVFILLGCHPAGQNKIFMHGGTNDIGYTVEDDSFFESNRQSFNVAMLLPLSGKASTYGQGLKNAAMMAIEDAGNSRLTVRFYDTQSSPEGADSAVRQAINEGNVLILGPLMSAEVSAAERIASSYNIPLISFSTSPEVLKHGVYTLGLLGSEQSERIIAYAASQNRRKIALLIPDTSAGINLAKAALKSAAANNGEIVKIAFYPPETLDFGEIVKTMTDYETRSAEVNKIKSKLTVLAEAGDASAARELKQLKTTYTAGEVDFDAVLIPETGSRLKSAAAMFGYYDVSYPDVLFLGTTVWENTNLSKETTLYHGVYPEMSRVHNDYFNKKYQDYFGEAPNQLYSFAYDGIALASALSRKNSDNLNELITAEDGYIGINGAFRIMTDGTNRHALNIMEVTADGPKVLNKAPKKFTDSVTTSFSNYVQPMPKFYGKNQAEAERLLFQPEPQYETFRFLGNW